MKHVTLIVRQIFTSEAHFKSMFNFGGHELYNHTPPSRMFLRCIRSIIIFLKITVTLCKKGSKEKKLKTIKRVTNLNEYKHDSTVTLSLAFIYIYTSASLPDLSPRSRCWLSLKRNSCMTFEGYSINFRDGINKICKFIYKIF